MLVSLKQNRKEIPEVNTSHFYLVIYISLNFHFSINNETSHIVIIIAKGSLCS